MGMRPDSVILEIPALGGNVYGRFIICVNY